MSEPPRPVRTLVVWCPDWPVVAAGMPLDVPVIVVRASRVVACSPAARAEGVKVHQRRREAQGRCPELVVIDHDPAVDVRTFEPVAAALESLTPRIEVVGPGCCAFPTRGPSRYHGGDQALAERVARLAAGVLAGRGVAAVGVADGPFAARLAAQSAVAVPPTAAPSVHATPSPGSGVPSPGSDSSAAGPSGSVAGSAGAPGTAGPAEDLGSATRAGQPSGTPSDRSPGDVPAVQSGDGRSAGPGTGAGGVAGGSVDGVVWASSGGGGDRVRVVEPGGSPAFLAPLSVRTLERPELVDVLERLGIRTLGDLAALPATDVVGRFGAEGQVAHRLARGEDERPPATQPPPADLSVTAEVDPPAERVEAAAFVARGLADELAGRLDVRGSACVRLAIGAETEHGERHERVWRTEGTFTAMAIADRVRWQVDGWLQSGVNRPTGGLTRLWLAPDEVVPAGGRQLAFAAGGPGAVDAVEAADRAARALARVQGLAGIEAVHVVEWRGGRGPGERLRRVPAAAVDVTEPRPAAEPGWVTEPWPGQVPAPAPSIVHDPPLPAEVLDAAGNPVTVSGRGVPSAAPATVVLPRRLDAAGPAAGGLAGPGAGRLAGPGAGGLAGPAAGPGPGAPASGPGASGAPVAGPTRREGVRAWAGPWPCDERWWDPASARRRARAQVVLADGTAHLLTLESGRWSVEATYD